MPKHPTKPRTARDLPLRPRVYLRYVRRVILADTATALMWALLVGGALSLAVALVADMLTVR